MTAIPTRALRTKRYGLMPLIAAQLVAAPLGWAHTASDAKFEVYTNPLHLADDALNLGIDVALTPWLSGGTFARVGQRNDSLGMRRTMGYGLRADYALNGQAFTSGWYAAPILTRQLVSREPRTLPNGSDASTVLSSTSLGMTFGYKMHQWGHAQRFFARVGLGASYQRCDEDVDLRQFPEGEDGVRGLSGGLFLPMADLDFGYTF